MKIIKVTKEYFETDEGDIIEHQFELDEVPSVEEFQKIYDEWEQEIKGKFPKKEDD